MTWEDFARTERIARRLPTRWLRGYARGKLWFDPAYRAVADRLSGSALPLLDLGCGVGLLGAYLRERGYGASVLGLDSDAQKIARGLRGEGLRLEVGEVTDLPEFCGHVALLDVLHYLSDDARKALLAGLAARVAPGGWCLIRMTPRQEGWRFRITEWVDRWAYRRAWMAQPVTAFPEIEEVCAHFPRSEFSHEVRPLWGCMPFNNWLLAFRRHASVEP